MMIGSIVRVLFLFAACGLQLTASFAQSVPSIELINNAKDYDGKAVVYRGEVVGDIMARAEYAWININDGSNAIGVWVKKELAKDIVHTGNYKAKGDLVEVTGEFHRSCPEHGGDLDIHAEALNIISPGKSISHEIDAGAVKFALGLSCAILLICLSRIIIKKINPARFS